MHWKNSKYPPRQWQREALPVALSAIRSGRKPIIRAIMGAGKSILIAEIVRDVVRDGTVVVTTPTIDLVDQLYDTIADRVGDLHVGRYYTHKKCTDRPVIICCNSSLPSLANDISSPNCWIADEVHRSETEVFKLAVEQLNPATRLGFTATPWRADEEGISLFSEVVYDYGPSDAVRDNVVVPYEPIWWGGGEIDLDEACLRMIKEHACGPGIVNAWDIDDSEAYADYLNSNGVRASAIHSRNRPNHKRLKLRLQAGELDCLVHVSLLQEGVNLPWLRWLCMRRSVGSRVRFAQEVGRVLRAHPGKVRAVILDPHGLFSKLSLDYEAVLAGGSTWSEPDILDEYDDSFDDPEAIQRIREESTRLATTFDGDQAFLRYWVIKFEQGGIIPAKAAPYYWTSADCPPTTSQIGVCWSHALRLGAIELGDDSRTDRLREIFSRLKSLTRAEVSDLTRAILGLIENQGWP